MNFFARYKKIFLILAFLAISALIGYLLWRVFFASNPINLAGNGNNDGIGAAGGLPSSETGNNDNLAGGSGNLPSAPGEEGGTVDNNIPGQGSSGPDKLSPIAVGGLTETKRLVDSAVKNATLSQDGGVQYYNPDDGKFYRIGKDGKPELMSDKVFYEVQNVVWAPNKSRAILEYPDGRKIIYDFDAKKQTTLPSYWEDFSFSPSSDQIISKSIALDPENNYLMTANIDGSGVKALEPIGENERMVYPAWSPSNQIVAMYTKGVDFNRQEVFFVGQNEENFKSTVIEGRGFDGQWSQDGERLLYSVYNSDDNMVPRLWVVDAAPDTISQNRQNLELFTWANKCTFASASEIYCAVPENLEKGAGLFPELANRTKDNLYKIDLSAGTKKLIAVPDGAYNISNLVVPSGQDTLYFSDEKNGGIYEIKLR